MAFKHLGARAMTSISIKAARAQLRREVGARRLPPITGSRPRPRGPKFLIAHACFGCRLSFKRAPLAAEHAHVCPNCAGSVLEMGRGFKAPTRREIERWFVLESLRRRGYMFPSSTQRSAAPYPTRARDLERFFAEHSQHPFRINSPAPECSGASLRDD